MTTNFKIYYDEYNKNIILNSSSRAFATGSLIATPDGDYVSVKYKSSSYIEVHLPYDRYYKEDDTPAGVDVTSVCTYLNTEFNRTPFVSSISQRVVEIDFGTVGVAEKTFTIVDAEITTSSVISAFQSGAAATGRDSDENEMDKLFVSAIANNGSLTLYTSCYPNVVSGKYKINYIVS
jgi:hypothetical protein